MRPLKQWLAGKGLSIQWWGAGSRGNIYLANNFYKEICLGYFSIFLGRGRSFYNFKKGVV